MSRQPGFVLETGSGYSAYTLLPRDVDIKWLLVGWYALSFLNMYAVLLISRDDTINRYGYWKGYKWNNFDWAIRREFIRS